MRPERQRDFIRRDGKCPLCDVALAGHPCTINPKAGRVHTLCALDPRRWKRWMEKVGLIPTEIKVEVIDDDKSDRSE